jgi:hypothetical protein
MLDIEADYAGILLLELAVDLSRPDIITVKTQAPVHPLGFDVGVDKLDLVVRIPSGILAGLSVQTNTGSIRVAGAFPAGTEKRVVSIDSHGGQALLYGVNGREVDIVAGDHILVQGLHQSGHLHVNSYAGDVLIGDVSPQLPGHIEAPNGSIFTEMEPGACALLLQASVTKIAPPANPTPLH